MRPHPPAAGSLAKALAVSTLVLAAGACSPPLDTEALEADLQGKVSNDTGATISQVECPDVKAETGGTFECTATDDAGITYVVKVTQTDDKGNVVYGYVNAEVPSPASPAA
jgi:hypothetical protein